MGSPEFPQVLSQEGQRGHSCVWQGMADKPQLLDLIGLEYHILYTGSYSHSPRPIPLG